MTRHTWRPGDAIDPGATYYPMDGARQGDPLEPDDVIAALDAHMEHTGIVDAMAQEIENLRAELDGRAPVSPTDHWSPWLEWRGGPCPLPGDTECHTEERGWSFEGVLAKDTPWPSITSFRYRADNPAGWLPRGKFIPPAELWDEGCPVRCEWTRVSPDRLAADKGFMPGVRQLGRDEWLGVGVTHIRFVARQPQAGLPEGFRIDEDGALWSEFGTVLNKRERERYGPAAIEQAVKAWLREMGDE